MSSIDNGLDRRASTSGIIHELSGTSIRGNLDLTDVASKTDLKEDSKNAKDRFVHIGNDIGQSISVKPKYSNQRSRGVSFICTVDS